MKFIYLCLLPLSLLVKLPSQKADKHPAINNVRLASPFPVFNYPDTSGNKISLNTVKGKKATLIVFWASWCSPCRKEIPALKAFYSQSKDKGISIVSISVDQNINAWKKAVKEEKMPWTNIANLPSDDQQIMDFFGIKSVPTMFLLDKDNQILLSDPTFEQVLAKIKTI